MDKKTRPNEFESCRCDNVNTIGFNVTKNEAK